MIRAVLSGVLVILLFSVWPMRAVNALCCLGVIMGGLIAGLVQSRRSSQLDPARGLQLGALTGVVASLAGFAINALMDGGGVFFDPIPAFIYTFLNGLWEGLRDLPNSHGAAWADSPASLTRVLIQLPVNAMMGAFGGAIAASLSRNERWVRRSSEFRRRS